MKYFSSFISFAFVFAGVFFLAGWFLMPHLPPVPDHPVSAFDGEFWKDNWIGYVLGVTLGGLSARSVLKKAALQDRQVIVPVMLALAFMFVQASISSAQVSAARAETLSAPVHPIYGKALKTVASDEHPTDLSAQSNGTISESVNEIVGGGKRNAVPRIPNRTNLLIDNVELQWSGGGSNFGYLYFCVPGGPAVPVWEFAACSKSNLTLLASEDLATQFVSFSDRTNRSGIGQAVFGPNWIRGGIRVRQGQVVLARLAGDHGKIYALEFAKQTPTNAVVFYLESPLSPGQTTPPERSQR